MFDRVVYNDRGCKKNTGSKLFVWIWKKKEKAVKLGLYGCF
jgi:hypothetical protein